MMKDAYAAAGVDIEAANEAVARYRRLLSRRADPRVLEGIGAFGGCFQFEGFKHPVLVASTDGVGTKVLVAAALGRYDTIGRDLVNHCINDILCAGAQPLFFLDYFAVSKLNVEMSSAVVSGIAAACAEFELALLGGETAEMPGVYADGAFDVAGTIVGAVERAELVDGADVVAGDAIVGLPANGFHTNGYSLVRATLPPERWAEKPADSAETIGDALLAVHPYYLPYVRAIQQAGIRLKAMAHITGGGLIHNLPRALPDGLAARLDRASMRPPLIMLQVVREARLGDETAYSTFNMGVGFCAIVARRDAGSAVEAANAALSAKPIPSAAAPMAAVVGEVEPSHPSGPRVII